MMIDLSSLLFDSNNLRIEVKYCSFSYNIANGETEKNPMMHTHFEFVSEFLLD